MDLEGGHEIVERPSWFIGIRWWPRQVRATLLVDEVVDIDVVHGARLHDIATSQQLKKTEIDVNSTERGKYRCIRPAGGADANVPQVDRRTQHVVAELVGAELDLLTREEGDCLVPDISAGRWGVNGGERDDDQRADNSRDDSKPTKNPPAPRMQRGLS
jgi:hypothetical protein